MSVDELVLQLEDFVVEEVYLSLVLLLDLPQRDLVLLL